MTEKRFTTNGYYIYDHFKGDKWLVNEVEVEYIVTKMNNIDTKARERSKALSKLQKENEQLKEALIELKEIGDYQYARIKELSDETEQLEQTNQRLTIALKEIKEKTNIYLEMTKKGEDQP